MGSPTLKAMNHAAMAKRRTYGKRQQAKSKSKLIEKIAKRKALIETDKERYEKERKERVAEYLKKQGITLQNI